MSVLSYQSHNKISFNTYTGISDNTIKRYEDKFNFSDQFYISDRFKIDALAANYTSTPIRVLIVKHRKRESCPHFLYNVGFSILYYRGNTKPLLQKKKNNMLYLDFFRITKQEHVEAAN